MKKAQLLITMFILALTVNAQNAVAKIKYEQAEEAFDKSDYATTLSKLDEAQKLIGTVNPKILYLRIMAQKGIIATHNYELSVLAEARNNAEYFIKNYEKNEGLEEKFKEVFLFSEELEKLPKTSEEFNWLKGAPEREKAQKQADALFFIDSLASLYRFKRGLTEEGFRVYNKYSAELVKKKKYSKDNIAYFRKQVTTDIDDQYLYDEGPTGMDITNGVVSAFKYVLKKTSADKNNLQEASVLFNGLKTRIYELFPADQIVETDFSGNHSLNVNSTSSALVSRITITLLNPGTFKEKYKVNVVQLEFE
jgi:hypothetical protein